MSKWTPLVVGSLFLATVTACNGNRGDNSNTGGAESGSMQSGTATDTGMAGGGGGGVGDTAAVRPGDGTTSGATGGESADTSRNTRTSDSAKGNQTKSGVTNTETGKSTLGKGATQTRPDQNQPVTAKGDTVRRGTDSTAVGQQ
jgi:hypothetical protein